MTDTQANIHKVAEIVRAIDMGAEDFVEVRVFHLTNSSPVEMAELLTNLFPDETKTGTTSQSPFAGRLGRFFGGGGGGPFGGGGPGGGGPGGGGGGTPGGGGSNTQNQRIKKRNRVIAVPDQRTTSLIVSATRDLMEQISDVITDLDASRRGTPIVKVFSLTNAEPQEVIGPLQDIFGSTTANSRNQQNQQNNPLSSRSATQGSSTSQSGSSSSSSQRMGTTTGSRGAGGGGGFGGP